MSPAAPETRRTGRGLRHWSSALAEVSGDGCALCQRHTAERGPRLVGDRHARDVIFALHVRYKV